MTDRQAAEAPKPNYDRLRAEVDAGAYPFYAEDEGELFARAEWLEAEVDALSVRLAQFEALTDSLEAILFGDNQSRDRDELEARAAELVAADARLAQAEQERDEAIEKLHRCRADFHAKVLGKSRSVYRGGEPPSDLPDDWVGT